MATYEYLSAAATLFGVVGLSGGVVGYFAKGRSDAIIKAQSELIDVRDKQISDKNQQIAALTAERDTLKSQTDVLTGLAQGSPQLGKLASAIENLPTKISQLIVKAMKQAAKEAKRQ